MGRLGNSMKDGQMLLIQQETLDSGGVFSDMVGISAGGRASGIAVGHVPGCTYPVPRRQ